MIKLYNTLTHSVEEFVPLSNNHVGMYSCGPTVYDYQHIGHMRRYVGDDILVRVLRASGYQVKHVMNITDVGHLVSDGDVGEDKMEKGAKKFGKSVWEVAKMFEEQFWNSTDALNIERPDRLMHATDYIKEQIALVRQLEEKGYTYRTSDGIYFDTAKFPDYFALSRQNPEDLKAGARVDMGGKKNVSDFALWKFSYPEGVSKEEMLNRVQHDSSKIQARQMEWESPWGLGFPGWHIECSAMSLRALTKFDPFDKLRVDDTEIDPFDPTRGLGSENGRKLRVDGTNSYTIDIHTGGIDHIAIHHTNEIAQAECATGQKFVNFWVHHNFLVVENTKMSKSLGNFITVQDVEAKGYDVLSLRYLYLQTHYRQEMNFTWEALDGAQAALHKLRGYITNDPDTAPNIAWMEKFMEALSDDLNASKALATVWEMVKDEGLLAGEKRATLLAMDKILGLSLDKEEVVMIPEEVQNLVKDRETFRKAGDFGASDELRKKIYDLGFSVKDTKEGPEVTPVKK